MYALDTTTLIYFFKGMGNVTVNLLSHRPSDIAIPAIVLYEIETGIAKSTQPERRRAQFHQLLDLVSVLPFDHATAVRAATVRAALENEGRPIGPLDTLIAATALASGATLVTHNTGEFNRVPQLLLADWF